MKTLLIGLTVLLLGGAGLLAAGPLAGSGSEAPTPTFDPTAGPSSSSTTSTTTTTTTGTTTTETGPTTTATTTVEDVRGPCDEAEHANDPRCTGVGARDDDRSGHGREDGDDHSRSGRGDGSDDDERDDDDDRSGSNRGSG
jgi:hypothetical protein